MTESVAVRSEPFVEATKERLRFKAHGGEVMGEGGSYVFCGTFFTTCTYRLRLNTGPRGRPCLMDILLGGAGMSRIDGF